jgi:hypothetical protein
MMKAEMELVQNMENAEDRDSEEYMQKLEKILTNKSNAVTLLRTKLFEFKSSRRKG